jgi:hypothetical protein
LQLLLSFSLLLIVNASMRACYTASTGVVDDEAEYFGDSIDSSSALQQQQQMLLAQQSQQPMPSTSGCGSSGQQQTLPAMTPTSAATTTMATTTSSAQQQQTQSGPSGLSPPGVPGLCRHTRLFFFSCF